MMKILSRFTNYIDFTAFFRNMPPPLVGDIQSGPQSQRLYLKRIAQFSGDHRFFQSSAAFAIDWPDELVDVASDLRFEEVVNAMKEQFSDQVFQSHSTPTETACLTFLEAQIVSINCVEPSSIERATSIAAIWDMLVQRPTAQELSTTVPAPLPCNPADVVGSFGHNLVMQLFVEFAQAVELQHLTIASLGISGNREPLAPLSTGCLVCHPADSPANQVRKPDVCLAGRGIPKTDRCYHPKHQSSLPGATRI